MGAEARRALVVADAVCAVRDLVNTPAEHMGPAELSAAVKAVARARGNVAEAARSLGISRATVYRKLGQPKG